jgi:rare lipoprotein A (peptidoglycan hydrolase)
MIRRLVVLFVFLSGLFAVPHVSSAATITATWYDLPPGPMANGKPFNSQNPAIAAGTETLFGKVLLVTNPNNKKSIIVSVTDRMSKNTRGTHIDLSRAGAIRLGFLEEGKIPVEIQVLPSR